MIHAMAVAVSLAGQGDIQNDPFGRRSVLVLPVSRYQSIAEPILQIADGILIEVCSQSIQYVVIPHFNCDICNSRDDAVKREQFVHQFRIGQSVKAASLFSGRIVAFRDSMTSTGMYYRKILIELRETDIASGVTFANGTAVLNDTVHSPNGDRSTLRAQLVRTAVANALRDLQSRILPRAKVLTIKENAVTISKGSNDGYKQDLLAIVLRGREQIAAGRIDTVQSDTAIVLFERFTKAPQPGDRVIPVYTIDVPLNCWTSVAPGKRPVSLTGSY